MEILRRIALLFCACGACFATARAGEKAEGAQTKDLAMGQYRCAVFLNRSYVPVQKITLAAGGAYATSTGGKGKYERNAKESRIDFTSGPLAGSFGRIEAEPEHDRVIFRLNQKKDESGSEHKKNWSAQYCTPIKE